MKKIVKLFAAITLILPFFFSGCDNPAFYGVTNDVVSEDATASGTISQITRYTASGTEFLVINADGGLRYKPASNRTHGGWFTYGGLPFSLHSYDYYNESHNGEQIIKIVADQTYLYILSCTYKNDNDEGTVAPDRLRLRYAKITSSNGILWDAANWTLLTESVATDPSAYFKVYKYSSTGYYYSAFSLFSTNSVNPAHRAVFLRSGKYGAANTNYASAWQNVSYYQIKDGAISSYTIPEGIHGPLTYTTDQLAALRVNIYGVAWFNGSYNFFSQPAVITNEKYSEMTYTDLQANSTYVEADFVYYSYGSYLYYINASKGWNAKTTAYISASRTISALAVCSDSILIGMGTWDASTGYNTYGGITKSNLSGGVPSGTTSFSTNAEAQITSGYHVYALLNANPAEAEGASALYAAIGIAGTGSSTGVAYSNIGLWSYYPSRGNWNRE